MKPQSFWRLMSKEEKREFADKAGRSYTMVSNIINGNQVGSENACRDIAEASEGKLNWKTIFKGCRKTKRSEK